MEATTNSNGKETIRPSKGTSLSFKVCWPGSTNVSASQIAYNLFIPVMALPSFLLLPRQKCQLQVISFLMKMIFEHPPQASPQPRSPACNLSCWISIPVSLSLPLPNCPRLVSSIFLEIQLPACSFQTRENWAISFRQPIGSSSSLCAMPYWFLP